MNDSMLVLMGFGIFCLTIIILRVLEARRKVVRNVLHGQVTYTIQGYEGHRAVEIAKILETGEDPDPDPDELEHRAVIKK